MEADKRTKERSAAYPGAPIVDILEFVAQLKKAFQKTMFTREDIMNILNRGSTVRRDIAAAVQYGLVDKTVGEGYKLTQLSEYILSPISPEEKMDNIAECFKRPKLYSDLIEKYKGQTLPADEVLAVVLARQHNITSLAAPQAVEIFIENAQFAGLLNEQRVLMPVKSQELAVILKEENLDEEVKGENADTNKSVNDSLPVKATENNSERTQSQHFVSNMDGKLDITIRLSGKKEAYLVYPITINAKDIQILKKQIELLEMTLDEE